MWGDEMATFRIATQRHEQAIEKKIKQMMQTQKIEEKQCHTTKDKTLTTYLFKCAKRESEQMAQVVAAIVNDIAQEVVLEQFADRYLKERQDMTQEEKDTIKELFIFNQYMAREEGTSYVSYYVIYIPILREIEISHELNMDGWIAFRMKKYQMILGDKIEQIIEEYKVQKEYLECLRYIVEARREQKTVDKILHLVPGCKGEMRLYNQQKADVTKQYISMYCGELLDEGCMRVEDLVVHILITVPPETLVIHARESYDNAQCIATIELIFEEAVFYCTACELCCGKKNDKEVDSLYEFD